MSCHLLCGFRIDILASMRYHSLSLISSSSTTHAYAVLQFFLAASCITSNGGSMFSPLELSCSVRRKLCRNFEESLIYFISAQGNSLPCGWAPSKFSSRVFVIYCGAQVARCVACVDWVSCLFCVFASWERLRLLVSFESSYSLWMRTPACLQLGRHLYPRFLSRLSSYQLSLTASSVVKHVSEMSPFD